MQIRSITTPVMHSCKRSSNQSQIAAPGYPPSFQGDKTKNRKNNNIMLPLTLAAGLSLTSCSDKTIYEPLPQEFVTSINKHLEKCTREQYPFFSKMSAPYVVQKGVDLEYHTGYSNKTKIYKRVGEKSFKKGTIIPFTIDFIKNPEGYKLVFDKDHETMQHSTQLSADGEIKDATYYKKRNERFQKQKEASNAFIFAKELKELPLFENIDKDLMSKFANAMKLSNLESSKEKDGVYNLFFDRKDLSYDVKLKKIADKEYAGMATILTAEGKSKLYIFKTEQLETNNSDKLRITEMQVVQDGLEDDTPAYKKHIKETRTTGSESADTSSKLSGKSRINLLWPGFNYSGKINSKTINTINQIITESNAEGKEIILLSVDKKSGTTKINGRKSD